MPVPPNLFTVETERYRGVARTVRRMVDMAREGSSDPVVREYALEATAGLKGGHYGHPDRSDAAIVAAAVHDFVAATVAYASDPHRIERIQDVEATLESGAGDCDDMALAIASLLLALNVNVRFVLSGPDEAGPYTHIYVEAQTPRGWLVLDPVIGGQAGDEVPTPLRRRRRSFPVYGDPDGGTRELHVIRGARPQDVAGIAGIEGAAPAWIVSGPKIWLGVTGYGQGYVDLAIEREYVRFFSCDVWMVLREPGTPRLVGPPVNVQLSKWTLNNCTGSVRLLVDPSARYDVAFYDGAADIGTAANDTATRLASAAGVLFGDADLVQPDDAEPWELYAKWAAGLLTLGVMGYAVSGPLTAALKLAKDND